MKLCTSTLAASVPTAVDVSRLDMRIGKIIDVRFHPNADTLYIEQSELSDIIWHCTQPELGPPVCERVG